MPPLPLLIQSGRWQASLHSSAISSLLQLQIGWTLNVKSIVVAVLENGQPACGAALFHNHIHAACIPIGGAGDISDDVIVTDERRNADEHDPIIIGMLRGSWCSDV